MNIRPATIADTEKISVAHRASIKALCAQSYGLREIEAWVGILVPEIYESAINGKIMIVAEEGDDILGLGILDPVMQEVCAVYVHPKAKGTGTGRRILLELERKASEEGIASLTLCSTLNARGFYKHHGYVEEGLTFHVLPNGVRLECVRMHKVLRRTTAG